MSDTKKELLEKDSYSFEDLVSVMEILRSEDGCPWDREQTHESIRNNFIEETYEVIEAIDTKNPTLLCEELGDVMLQVVFHAEIESEKGVFSISDVTDGICKKLILRHPHVFGNVNADTSEEVLKNWEKIKSEEKQRLTVADKLRAIPPMLPALMRAEKVGKKASCLDFPDADSAAEKVREELAELENAAVSGNAEKTEEEAGDLLLAVTSLCRKLGVCPENALNKATDKFISRFSAVENAVTASGKDIKNMNMSELDALWDEIKHKKL